MTHLSPLSVQRQPFVLLGQIPHPLSLFPSPLPHPLSPFLLTTSLPILTQFFPFLLLKVTPVRSFAAAFRLSQKAATWTFLPRLIKGFSGKTGAYVWSVAEPGPGRETPLYKTPLQKVSSEDLWEERQNRKAEIAGVRCSDSISTKLLFFLLYILKHCFENQSLGFIRRSRE